MIVSASWFLVVLAISLVVFAIGRPFKRDLKFQSVFEALATGFSFLPMVLLAPFALIGVLIMYPMLGFIATLFVSG